MRLDRSCAPLLRGPTAAKLKKQYQCANQLGIPFTAVIGESEAERGTLQLKDMNSGEQSELEVAAAVSRLREMAEGLS